MLPALACQFRPATVTKFWGLDSTNEAVSYPTPAPPTASAGFGWLGRRGPVFCSVVASAPSATENKMLDEITNVMEAVLTGAATEVTGIVILDLIAFARSAGGSV